MEPLWVQKWKCHSPIFFMVEMETELIQQSDTKPREWKRYIDDVFSHWDCDRKVVNRFIKRANYFHPTIKFTAEISDNQITFLDSTVFKGERFTKDSIWDVKTHNKPTETFQSTHFTSCHPPGVKYGFIFEKNIWRGPFEIQTTPQSKRVPRKHHRRVSVRSQLCLLTIGPCTYTKAQRSRRLLPFVTTYHPAVKKFKTNIHGTLESDTQSALAHLLQQGKISLRTLRHVCGSKNVKI